MITLLVVALALLVAAGCGVALRSHLRRRPRRVCGNCVHFDLAEGQATIRQFPAFAQYAQHVSPKRSGERYVRDDADEVVQLQTSEIPARCEWAAFGACLLKHTLVWEEHDATPLEGDQASPCGGRSFRARPRHQLRVLA